MKLMGSFLFLFLNCVAMHRLSFLYNSTPSFFLDTFHYSKRFNLPLCKFKKVKTGRNMSRVWTRIVGLFSNQAFVGKDKTGNRYFTRTEEIDGIMKEKRWVIFKGEQDPTSVPVEWICWLNGQRKKAPTPEEMAELEARRERVRMNVVLLKKQEEERKAREGKAPKIGKEAGPDLRTFIQQFPTDSEGSKIEEASGSTDVTSDKSFRGSPKKKQVTEEPESSEPTGSGASFRPGTWQPPV